MRNYYTDIKNLEIDKELYVTIDSIEFIEEKTIQIVFDGILTKEFNEIISGNIFDVYESVTPQIIVITVNEEFYNSFFPEYWSRNFHGKWFTLNTTNFQTSLAATISIENTEIPVALSTYIHSIEKIFRQSEISQRLLSFFSMSNIGNGNIREIKNHLDSIKPRENLIHKLNVYNVGQGSLTAVTDQENTPLFYYDLGGAWWIFPNSYPITINLCFSIARTVILSHWDLDHVETARRLFYSNPAILRGITWIAPKQTLSPLYARLASKMAASGRLVLWSGNYTQVIPFWAGALVKCNGPDKNNSGIAILVNSPKNSIKSVLHPGDAAYTYIPFLNTLKLDGIVATHHGANFDINNHPVPVSILNHGAIAYSHDNKYGHPTPLSLNAHHRAKWTNIRETTHGSISFVIGRVTETVTCGNRCNLNIQQSF
jgi:hypothetical protein